MLCDPSLLGVGSSRQKVPQLLSADPGISLRGSGTQPIPASTPLAATEKRLPLNLINTILGLLTLSNPIKSVYYFAGDNCRQTYLVAHGGTTNQVASGARTILSGHGTMGEAARGIPSRCFENYHQNIMGLLLPKLGPLHHYFRV